MSCLWRLRQVLLLHLLRQQQPLGQHLQRPDQPMAWFAAMPSIAVWVGAQTVVGSVYRQAAEPAASAEGPVSVAAVFHPAVPLAHLCRASV
jgi:hypothetical protein